VPSLKKSVLHPDFMYRSAKYLSITFELIDESLHVSSETTLPVDFLLEHELFSGANREDNNEIVDTPPNDKEANGDISSRDPSGNS
jgi:hypothetical protein